MHQCHVKLQNLMYVLSKSGILLQSLKLKNCPNPHIKPNIQFSNNTVNICAPLRHKKVCSTEIVPRLYPCWLLAQGPALLVHYKSGPGWAGLYSTLRNNYAKIDHLYTTCQSPAANSISSYQHAINHIGEMWKPSTSTV